MVVSDVSKENQLSKISKREELVPWNHSPIIQLSPLNLTTWASECSWLSLSVNLLSYCINIQFIFQPRITFLASRQCINSFYDMSVVPEGQSEKQCTVHWSLLRWSAVSVLNAFGKFHRHSVTFIRDWCELWWVTSHSIVDRQDSSLSSHYWGLWTIFKVWNLIMLIFIILGYPVKKEQVCLH